LILETSMLQSIDSVWVRLLVVGLKTKARRWAGLFALSSLFIIAVGW
jgi:hypothetical protein